jgi:uncharacterized membrane protein
MNIQPRLDSVDLLRGLVMVLMALDHVRDYFTDAHFSPTDLSRTNAALFFTRWITHFCAPVFFVLAGGGAYLSMRRGRARSELGFYLFTRGLWLIVLELTVVSFAWTFNLDQGVYLQVIWALGWSMVALSGLIFLPRWAIAVFSVALIVGHHLLDGLSLQDFRGPEGVLGWDGWLLSILHISHGPVSYPLIPWIGVMALGYAGAPILLEDPQKRSQWLLGFGALLTVAFVILRAANLYGDPAPWSPQKSDLFTFLSFLNTTKYPPSLLYLLMTLGPALAALALFENRSGPVARFLTVFGRVPLFFYLVHLYLIHTLALIAGYLSGYALEAFLTSDFLFPEDYGYSLPVVYLVWIAVVLMLYPLCAWFTGLKTQPRQALRYL